MNPKRHLKGVVPAQNLLVMILSAVAFGSLIQPKAALAYGIGSHTLFTKRAVYDYQVCRSFVGGPSVSAKDTEAMVRANSAEDYNIFVKSVNWHFYHPWKNLGKAILGMGRASLKERVLALENKMSKKPSFKNLGALIHFVQDVTNPAHVVPVFHWLSDGFDYYKFENAMPEPITEAYCKNLFSKFDLKKTYFEVLHFASIETLERVDTTFTYAENGTSKSMKWSEGFWIGPSSPNGFGKYGRFGNKYGTEKLGNVTIAPQVYAEFSKKQVRAALDLTMEYLYLYLNRR